MKTLVKMLKENPKVPINLDLETDSSIFLQNYYYVFCKEDDTVLLAIKPKTTLRYIRWFDGTYERVLNITSAHQLEDVIILNINNKEYYFQPVNYALYINFIKPRLIKPPNIDSENELIQYLDDSYYY